MRLPRRIDSREKVIKRGRRAQRRLEQRSSYIPSLFVFETKESLFFRYATDGKHRAAFQHIQPHARYNKSDFRAVFTHRALSRAFIQRKATNNEEFREDGRRFFVKTHRLSGFAPP